MGAGDDAAFRNRARQGALRLAGSIGGSRDVRFLRNVVDGLGVDPVAVRVAVLARDGHPMTPHPSAIADDIADDIADEGVPDGWVATRCPIWTTVGRSRWEMTIVSERHRGFVHSHVLRLVNLDDGEVLDASSAPCPPRRGSGWAGDADYSAEVWPGASGDPRVPRGAFVGNSYGVMFSQLLAGIHETPPDQRALTPGQAAIALLDVSYTAIYGDGLPAAYDTVPEPDFESDIIDACELIGADTYADVFRRIRELLPPEARGSWEGRCEYLMPRDDDEDHPHWEALADELRALEEAGDLIWEHMLAYVHSHSEEFFLPEEESQPGS